MIDVAHTNLDERQTRAQHGHDRDRRYRDDGESPEIERSGCARQEQLLECRGAPQREEDPEERRRGRDEQHLEQRFCEQPAASGAEGHAHCELTTLLRGAGHLQVDDVRDGHQQHEQRDALDPERDLSGRIERALLGATGFEGR
jgi:hypothetical protein